MTGTDGIAVQRFVDVYPPGPDVEVPTRPFLEYAEQHAPATLVELWRAHGLGFYGDRRIALVDPADWSPVLQTWFGPQATSFPFAVTSFGHVYHYDRAEGRDRIQCLDPHFQTNAVIPGDLVSFFTGHLPGPTSHLSDLEGPRGGALDKLGELRLGEIYCFTPILALGGQVRPDCLDKADGVRHLQDIHRQVRAQKH